MRFNLHLTCECNDNMVFSFYLFILFFSLLLVYRQVSGEQPSTGTYYAQLSWQDSLLYVSDINEMQRLHFGKREFTVEEKEKHIPFAGEIHQVYFNGFVFGSPYLWKQQFHYMLHQRNGHIKIDECIACGL